MDISQNTIKDSLQMSSFDKHLENIANAISVEDEARSCLEKDFELIRAYLIDILRNDPIIGPMLVYSKFRAGNFNCSITLDFSRFMALGVMQTQYPSFLKIGQRGRVKVVGMLDMPFFSNGENIAGGVLTNIVKGLIAQGLDLSGYFVRGHLGDIYELELTEDTKSVDHIYTECESEWQTNYILLNATTEVITMKIRMRVLVKFCNKDVPNDLMPYPTHNLKMVWLAAADVRYLEYFSLCAPLSERQLVAYPMHLLAMRLLSSLIERHQLHTLKKIHVESVSYELVYTRARNGLQNTKESVIEVIEAIIRRMLDYMYKKRFPYYFNIKEDLLLLFKNHANKLFTQNRLREVLEQIRYMRQDKDISYEEVERLFGVHINSHIFNVDDFGIYRSFNKPKTECFS